MVDNEKVKNAVEGLYETSKEYINDVNKTNKLIDDVQGNKDVFDKISSAADDFPVLIDMIKDFINKKYTNVPVKTIVSIIATVIYVVNPMDIIPDFIFGLGLIDDMAAVSFCIKCVKADIENYKQWKAREDNVVAG